MSQKITLTAGTFPEGYCFTTLQQYYNDILSLTDAQLPGTITPFNYGAEKPDPSFDYPWIRTDDNGNFDRIYTFGSLGVWTSPHPTPPGSNERRIWVGLLSELPTYDGGDGGGLSTITGPMWEVDTAFNLRFPYGSDGDSGTVKPKDTGGSATAAGLPAHTHTLPTYTPSGGTVDDFVIGDAAVLRSADNRPGQTLTTFETSSSGSGAGTLDTIPPFYGVFFIKRTSRVYYTVAAT